MILKDKGLFYIFTQKIIHPAVLKKLAILGINRLTRYATVIGVSPDSIKSHKSFKEKQSLNFILLSDPEHKLAEDFEVWKEKSMYGRKYMGIERSTFIIDKNGKIEKEWRKVKVKGHVDEVIEYLNTI